MHLRFLIMSILITHTLFGQESVIISKPITDQEQIKWGGTYKYKTNPYDTLYGFYTFYLQTISYSKSGVELWTFDLPERMRDYEAQSIYDKITDSNGVEHKLLKNEIDVNRFYYKEFLKCPVFTTDKIIAISDRSGFLLLNKGNGSLLANIEYEYKENFFWFDKGNFAIKTGKQLCKEIIPSGSSFIAQCGENLFHFNEQELFVWNDKNILLERIRYKKTLHSIKTNTPLHYKALFRNRDFRVEIEGWVFTE